MGYEEEEDEEEEEGRESEEVENKKNKKKKKKKKKESTASFSLPIKEKKATPIDVVPAALELVSCDLRREQDVLDARRSRTIEETQVHEWKSCEAEIEEPPSMMMMMPRCSFHFQSPLVHQKKRTVPGVCPAEAALFQSGEVLDELLRGPLA